VIRVEALLHRTARMFPRAIAIADAHRTVTYEAFELEVRRAARVLAALGVGARDRVVVLAHNRVEYVALYFACAELSAVLVPLNTRLVPREIAGLAARSRARLLVADARYAAALDALPEGCRGLSLDAPSDGFPAFADATEADALPPPSFDVGDVAVQMYTSGTTGLPKGAMLTHANVTSMTAAWLLELPVRGPEHTFLQVTPLYHVGAMLMVMSCVATGTKLVLRDFAPAEIARVLAHGGVTHTLLVPAMIRFLLDGLGDADVSFPDLRMVVYGASPIPITQLRRAQARFGCDLLQGYGLTETAGVLTALRPRDHDHDPAKPPPTRVASAGRPTLGVEIRIARADGGDADAGEVGEILARGPNVFIGYHEMPEATADAFDHGWLRTGDLGTLDEEGYVSIVDRSKDMIIVGGENVYPSEVGEVMREHALVSDVAVVGVPDERWGEAVRALVVASRELLPGEEDAALIDLLEFARARLARFKCPSRVELIAEIPRNAAGKVLKAALRAPYWAGRERKV
jgi:long-chain acyl-CoA synthetase